MNASDFASRVAGARQNGPGKWNAPCPAHDDRWPSLSITEKDDGGVLIHCHAGCEPHEVVSAVGVRLCDLFPPRPREHAVRGQRMPYVGADVLRALHVELLLVVFLACDIAEGKPLDDALRARARIAAARVLTALDMALPQRDRRRERRAAVRAAVAELQDERDAA